MRKTKKQAPDNGIDVREIAPGHLSITCTECSEPIDHSDEYGMWCKNECGREDSKAVSAMLTPFLKGLFQ